MLPNQWDMHVWRKHNFPDSNPTQQLLGVVEEVGELSHAHLKEAQGIRGSTGLHVEEAKDAVGDIVIYLMGYCSYRGWDLEELVTKSWDHVKQRDWIRNPQDGGT